MALALGSTAAAQVASDVTGVYNTGLSSSGGLQTGGLQAANWTVTYASTNGGSSANTAYEGAGYVISPASVSGSAYTPDTGNAQWITAPGAYQSAGAPSPTNVVNAGGDFLPGNGNTGSNEGVYVYTLAFTIVGTGSAGTVVNSALSKILISMTIAADDQYSVYVNPNGYGSSNGTTVPTGTAASSRTSAWSNTIGITLANYTATGITNNSTFYIGTNYVVIVVDNTNSATGSSTSTALNASGLLVYESSAAEINGVPVPEVWTWLPIAAALGCYGYWQVRRNRGSPLQAVA